MKKCLFVALLFFVGGLSVISQDTISSAKGYKIKTGVIIGTGLTILKVKESNWRNSAYGDSLNSFSSKSGSTHLFGFFIDLALGTRIHLEPAFSFVYSDSKIIYKTTQNGTITKALNQLSLDIPIQFSIKMSKKRSNCPYLFGGVAFKINIESNSEFENLGIWKKNGSVNFGFGHVFAIKGIHFRPEVHFTSDLITTNSKGNNLYNSVISDYKANKIFFLLKICK